MKKFALFAALCIVSCSGLLFAEEDREAINPSPLDEALKQGTKGRTINSNIIRSREEVEKILQELSKDRQAGTKTQKVDTPAPEPQPEPATQSSPKRLHTKAKYVITKWSHNGKHYTLEVEDMKGKKMPNVDGVAGRGVTLRMPIQFTIPYWVTEMHVDIGENYSIEADGTTLRELDAFNENGHKFRKAYPGDTVLLEHGRGMTMWIED